MQDNIDCCISCHCKVALYAILIIFTSLLTAGCQEQTFAVDNRLSITNIFCLQLAVILHVTRTLAIDSQFVGSHFLIFWLLKC